MSLSINSLRAGVCLQMVASALIFIAATDSHAVATLVHRYSFNGNVDDSVGGADGTLVNGLNGGATPATYSGGQLSLNNPGNIGSGTGNGNHVDLPTGMISALTDATFEAWVQWDGGYAWQRIFDFGGGPAEYIFATPSSGFGGNPSIFEFREPAVTTGDDKVRLLDAQLPIGSISHIVGVIDTANDQARYYVDGNLNAVAGLQGFSLTNVNDVQNWLGRSQWAADSYLNGSYDEFRIYSSALTDDDVIASFDAGPDTLVGQVPEPATVSLCVLGGLALLRRTRRPSSLALRSRTITT